MREEKTVIYMPVFNRLNTAIESIHNIRIGKGQAHLKVIDDHSTEFDGHEIVALGDSGQVNEANRGIDDNRMSQLGEFLQSDFDYCYFTDSDTLHDPNFLARAFQMFEKTNSICCLYNSTGKGHREGFNVDIGDAITIRRTCPGISMFFDKNIASRLMLYYLEAVRFRPSVVQDYGSWDWFFITAAPHVAVSQISYVEHIYADGLHASLGEDMARFPTPYLRQEGPRVFERLGIPYGAEVRAP